jgi:hypothetical protein
MLVTIKVYVKGKAIRLTVEECMEVTHWNGILRAVGKMGVDRSIRLFPLPRCKFFIVVLLKKSVY